MRLQSIPTLGMSAPSGLVSAGWVQKILGFVFVGIVLGLPDTAILSLPCAEKEPGNPQAPRLLWISKAEAAESQPDSSKPSAPEGLRLGEIEPTVLFVQKEGKLLQVVQVTLENPAEPVEAELVVQCASGQITTPLGKRGKGKSSVHAHVPDVTQPTELQVSLTAGGKVQDRRTIPWQPGRHWEVCLVPISHHDLGYTDTLENVLRKYDGFYDDILRFCSETDQFPEEAKFRYRVEGSWSLQHFVENRPPQVVEQLGKYLREGRIEVSALYGNLITNLCGHEEQIRALYPSFRFQRRFGAPIRTASITDIPGLSWGLPTVLGGAGVDYFFAGLATYFEWGRHDIHTFWDEAAILRHGRPDAFWWEGPDGQRVLVYYQGGYGCWNPGSYEDVLADLPGMLQQMEKQGTPFSVVRFGGYGCGDNTQPTIRPSQIVREWNSRWAYPKLFVATHALFFEKLRKQCQDIRTFRGELPDTDYVVGATATARETTENRLTHDLVPTAEKLAALASLLAGGAYPAEAIAQAYDNMLLYDEHTWGMHSGLQVTRRQQWSWNDKARYAYRAAGLAETVLESSVRQLAHAIRRPEEGWYIVVFNPLSFVRTDLVRISGLVGAQPGFDPETPLELMDLQSGAPVACQVVEINSPRTPVLFGPLRYGRGRFNPPERFDLVFVAEDVPPLGWKTFRVATGSKDGDQPAAKRASSSRSLKIGPTSLENQYFRVVLDQQTGAIQSIYDKEQDREMVDKSAPHQLNQLVVKDVQTGHELPLEKGAIRLGENGPVYGSLLVSTQAPGCPQVTQEIMVYEKMKRVDLANRLLRDSTPLLELYFAFPFQIQPPRFCFEGSNSVIVPMVDQFPGSNTNYYAVQHWAAVSDDRSIAVLAPIEAHLVEFGGLWPCYVSQAHHGFTSPEFGRPFVKPEELTRGYMYSFVHSSNYCTNFPTLQQADLLFRFSVSSFSGDGKTGRARDFGWAAANPLVPFLIQGKSGGPLEPLMSFCQIEPASVLLLALKQAEDGDGLILRLLETEGRPTQVKLTLPHRTIVKAWQTNLVEQNQTELPTSDHQTTVSCKPFQPVTVRLQLR